MPTTKKKSDTLLEEMRSSRRDANVAFIKFTENREFFSDYVFCFYEGEDGKYYTHKVRDIIGDNYITIVAGNKKEVLKAWELLKCKQEYENVKKMFFIDRDMDEIPNDCNEDLYITPCYSIENLYANTNTFIGVLKTEFALNHKDKDYKICLDKFNKDFEKFNNIMLEFNALVLLKKIKNAQVSLDTNTNHLFEISLGEVKEHIKYDQCILKLKTQLSCCDMEIDTAKKQLISMGSPENCFRGKNQLDFIVTFINFLKEQHKKGLFFTEKKNSVNINLTKNRLTELYPYATFPDCLRSFLELHKLS